VKPDDATDGTANGERKILYAGLVPGSTQQQSGLSAASGVHDLVTTNKKPPASEVAPKREDQVATSVSASNAKPPPMTVDKTTTGQKARADTIMAKSPAPLTSKAPSPASAKASKSSKEKKPAGHNDPNLTEEERRKLKKKRRKRKLLRLARRKERERLRQQNPTQQPPANVETAAKASSLVRKKSAHAKGQKKKGPRSVEYICALCSEAYTSTCDYNPWWALAQHDCPKCRKTQVRLLDESFIRLFIAIF
jgi:hypothetical protein